VLRQRIERNLEGRQPHIIVAYGGKALNADEVYETTLPLTQRLAPFMKDTMHYLNARAADGDSILIEGAQATLLDVDHGTYPFVPLPARLPVARPSVRVSRRTNLQESLDRSHLHYQGW